MATDPVSPPGRGHGKRQRDHERPDAERDETAGVGADVVGRLDVGELCGLPVQHRRDRQDVAGQPESLGPRGERVERPERENTVGHVGSQPGHRPRNEQQQRAALPGRQHQSQQHSQQDDVEQGIAGAQDDGHRVDLRAGQLRTDHETPDERDQADGDHGRVQPGSKVTSRLAQPHQQQQGPQVHGVRRHVQHVRPAGEGRVPLHEALHVEDDVGHSVEQLPGQQPPPDPPAPSPDAPRRHREAAQQREGRDVVDHQGRRRPGRQQQL